MIDERELRGMLERRAGTISATPTDAPMAIRRARRRLALNAAVGTLVGLAVLAGALAGMRTIQAAPTPGDPPSDPRSPFLGAWVATDADGSTQAMIVRASGDGAVEIVMHDDAASVCSGVPSTMTGTGRLEGSTYLVIPSPVLTCDDGSEPEALSGPPLEDQFRNLTYILDAETETLTDSFGGVWRREGAEEPNPEQTLSGGMWPQTSPEEVRQAQELADAGDPAYTWQVDPRLISQESDPLLTDPELWGYLRSPGTEIAERFLREQLGWEEFLFSGEGTSGGELRGLLFLRCAPGETNPLYPTAWDGNQEAPGGHRCAPTIDELRYEAVRLDLSQPDRRGFDGIWVVSRWTTTRFAQTDPSVVEAEATARLEDFLRARIEGEGAEGYVEVFSLFGGPEDVPLLYATTTGAPYERFEIERVGRPYWPYGEMEFTVRLFAEGGETMVEQLISFFKDENGRLTFHHNAASTTQNGRPLSDP